nr:hypothetical protein [Pseudotabrizicola sediminis]
MTDVEPKDYIVKVSVAAVPEILKTQNDRPGLGLDPANRMAEVVRIQRIGVVRVGRRMEGIRAILSLDCGRGAVLRDMKQGQVAGVVITGNLTRCVSQLESGVRIG